MLKRRKDTRPLTCVWCVIAVGRRCFFGSTWTPVYSGVPFEMAFGANQGKREIIVHSPLGGKQSGNNLQSGKS